MPHFDPLGFSTSYECEVNPELPGDGNWKAPTYFFGTDGERDNPSALGTGTPLVVRVHRDDGAVWVGTVVTGGIGGVSGAFGCPDPEALCLVYAGQAFIVDTRNPGSYRPLVTDVQSIRHFRELDMLLLASWIDVTAVGHGGQRWTTARLCLDELRLLSGSPSGIVCSGSFLDRDETLVIAPEDGRLLSGPVCPY